MKRLAPQGTVIDIRHREISAEVIHTRIVLKGSPLTLSWQENILTTHPAAEIKWTPENCIYCHQCEQTCPRGCLHMTDNGLQIDREKCTACGDCTKTCPSMALEMIGQTFTAADLIHKLLKQNYSLARKIRQVIIGGGEPALQPEFCRDLLFQIEQTGLPGVIETSGMAPFDDLLPLLYRAAEVRYELICINPELHLHLTGYENTLILENLVRTAIEIQPPARLIVRTPLLRGHTTQPVILTRIGDWLQANLGVKCHRWELFEPEYACTETPDLTEDEIAAALDSAQTSGFPAGRINLRGEFSDIE